MISGLGWCENQQQGQVDCLDDHLIDQAVWRLVRPPPSSLQPGPVQPPLTQRETSQNSSGQGTIVQHLVLCQNREYITEPIVMKGSLFTQRVRERERERERESFHSLRYQRGTPSSVGRVQRNEGRALSSHDMIFDIINSQLNNATMSGCYHKPLSKLYIEPIIAFYLLRFYCNMLLPVVT